jgi:hypothetical protein
MGWPQTPACGCKATGAWANLAEPLANLVILSADAFYRGEGSALGFANAQGMAGAGKTNADSSPQKAGSE